jgi:hypothetical protein
MRSLLIGFLGGLGIWAMDNFSVALEILISVVTVFALLYEKGFFRFRCRRCLYFDYYNGHEKKEIAKGTKFE